MSRLSEHHKPKAGLEGKCSVPMWCGGLPAGFCDSPAYGEQYEGKFLPEKFWSARWEPTRKPFAMALCCKGHGGPGPDDIRFMRDGNMWMAFRPGFENLAESVAGFGETQEAALADLEKYEATGQQQ